MVIDAVQFKMNDLNKIFFLESARKIGEIFWERKKLIEKGEIKKVIKLSLFDLI